MRHYRILAFLLFGFVGTAMAQSTSSPEEKIAALEKKAEELAKQISELDARLEKKWQLLPSATLWITRDFQVSRTAVPEYYSKHLAWVILRDGKEILQRSADNEMTLGLLAPDGHLPGDYVVFLSTRIDGSYRPISNVLTFQIPADPATPASSPSASSAPSPVSPRAEPRDIHPAALPKNSDLNSRLGYLNDRLDLLAERTTEYRAYCEQQRSLPRTLDLWMDARRVLHRTVGPEDIEASIGWEIEGPNSLGRNAIGEIAFPEFHQKTGRYLAYLTSGNKQVSQTISYDIIQPDQPPSEENDGL